MMHLSDRWRAVFASHMTRTHGTIFRIFNRLWTPVVRSIFLFVFAL